MSYVTHLLPGASHCKCHCHYVFRCHVTHLLPGTSHCKCHCHYVFRCHTSLAFCLVPVIVTMYSDVTHHSLSAWYQSLFVSVIVTMYSDVTCHSPSVWYQSLSLSLCIQMSYVTHLLPVTVSVIVIIYLAIVCFQTPKRCTQII